MGYILAAEWRAKQRQKPLRATMLQIAAWNAVGNESRVANTLKVAILRNRLMNRFLVKKVTA